VIVRRGREWLLMSKDGRVLGRHRSREDAARQEAAIEANRQRAVRIKEWASRRAD